MAKAIIMPKQGLQMTEGTISKWLYKEGDRIQAGEPLFEMETDKLSITIDASDSGTLLRIVHPAFDVVPITETIAIVGEPGEDYSALLPAGTAEETSEAPAASPETAARAESAPAPAAGERVFVTPRARLRAEERDCPVEALAGSGPDGLVIERDVLDWKKTAATPLARKIAALDGIALADVAGNGPRGKITAADVRAKAAPAPASPASDAEDAVRRTPMTNIRKMIATHMCRSLSEMAQANHRITVDMSEIQRVREQLIQNGVKISYNVFVLRCVAKALKEFPMLNARLEGNDILEFAHVNLGVAVATERGLIVPVVRCAERMTLAELAGASGKLASAVKEGTAAPDDLADGTFTVTNLGMYDIDSFTAIINAPEAAILAVGRIAKQPVVVGDAVAIRPMMQLSLTYDHRIVDGAPAAQFLRRVKALLEAPAMLL